MSMNEHQVFKSPVIPVVLMITGLNNILENILLSIWAGIGIYAAVIWIERIGVWKDR